MPGAIALIGGDEFRSGCEELDRALLAQAQAAGVEVPNLCRGGVCGQCTTRYLSGAVEHRDHYLDEQQRGAALMPCVSRGGCSGTLLLDL